MPAVRPNSTQADGQTLEESVADLMATDDELRTQMRLLLLDVIRDARRTMRTGTPAAKAPLHRTFVPYLLRGMAAQEDAEGRQETNDRLDGIHATIRGAIIPTREVPTLPAGA